jgi:hypothetical protein
MMYCAQTQAEIQVVFCMALQDVSRAEARRDEISRDARQAFEWRFGVAPEIAAITAALLLYRAMAANEALREAARTARKMPKRNAFLTSSFRLPRVSIMKIS